MFNIAAVKDSIYLQIRDKTLRKDQIELTSQITHNNFAFVIYFKK